MDLGAVDLPSESPNCAGVLLKLDPVAKLWRKRLCILCDACLYIYVDENSKAALGGSYLLFLF